MRIDSAQKNRGARSICIIATIVLVAIIVIFWCCQKKGMFIDEIYTHGLSNSYYTPSVIRIKDKGIVDQVLTHEDFFEYVSVDYNDRFSFGSVYYNQTQDVHPPLYYFIFHTICSLFPRSFTKWIGLGLNIVLLAATLFFLYRLSILFFDKWLLSLLICIVYSVSCAGLSTMLMIRMYMLLALLTVLLTYVVYCNKKAPKNSHYFQIAVIIFAGMMTQYFFAIYASLLCASYILYLIYKKHWKGALLFSISALSGVAGMLISFPSWYNQLHSQETVSLKTVSENATADMSICIDRIITLTKELINEMPIAYALVLIGFFSAIIIVMRYGINCIPKAFAIERIVVIIPTILAFIVVAIIAPYLALRYVYNILPIIVLVGGCFWNISGQLLEKFKTEALKQFCLSCVIVITVITAFSSKPQYLNTEYAHIDSVMMKNAGSKCIYISTNSNPSITSDIEHLLYFQDVCIVDNTESSALSEYLKDYVSDSLIVFISKYPNQMDDKKLLNSIASNYMYTDIQTIANEGLTNIYCLKR